MYDPRTKKHNQNEGYRNESQQNDAAHLASTLLHGDFGLIDVGLGQFDIVVGLFYSIADEIEFFSGLVCQNTNDF